MLQFLYRAVGVPILFLLDAEAAHRLVAGLLGAAHRVRGLARLLGPPAALETPDDPLVTTVLGKRFASPVGVAAGFDKAGRMYNALGALGFGFVEIGTVTAMPQPGNPRPRLFRLAADRALVNRMGFNNPGAAAVADAVRHHPPRSLVLGINLGKSKVAPLDDAPADYAESARHLAPLADYLVINVSSPNTPGLRSLQSVEALRPVIAAVQAVLSSLASPPPLLVKIAPDLADEDVDAVVDLALEMKLAGLIATNTTIAREGLGLVTPPEVVAGIGAGGLSGAPLRPRALAVIRRLHRRAGGRLVIIGVGGIESAAHAWEAIAAGAALVQIYTGMVYGGPALAREIAHGLRARLRESGIARVADLVGSEDREAA